MIDSKKAIPLALFALSLFTYILIGYYTKRTDFLQYILLYYSAFILYLFWYFFAFKQKILKESIAAGMLFRLALLFSLPNLSDDFYRFIWDGRLSAQGINPFLLLPSELINNSVATVDTELFKQLNSKGYYSVYPPLNQFIFYLSAMFSSKISGSVFVLKSFIVCCELGTIYISGKILRKYRLNENLILLYALNPLVIIELTGNIHFEAAMLFFSVLSVYFIFKGKKILSAISLSIAICTKFWPLFFIPFFYKRYFHAEMHQRKSGLFDFAIWVGCILLFTVMLFIPFFNLATFRHIASSVNLYFQHFEFNGSLFYLIRWVGFELKGYDIIHRVGHLLPLACTLLICRYYLLEKKENLQLIFLPFLLSLSVFLFFATTVHPWYITPLVLYCIFTNYRYPVLWSAVIPLTYIAYSNEPVKENNFFIAVEYLMVLFFAYYESAKLRNSPYLKFTE